MAKIIVNNPRQVINGGAKKYYFKVKGLGGPKGDKGDKGDTGATGPQGPQGNAATVSIGSTTTLPVGNDATVTNSGSIYNAVLNFGIPQGPRGPQGATGAKGDKGDKGDQGNPGPQGEKGTNATVTVGTTTTTGPGTQAYAWNSSSNPNNAVINFNIPRGATGATGATGPQGPTGPAGADGADGQDGQNFTPTIVETLPTTGDQSKLYLTPKAHTTSTATGNPIEATVTEQAGQLESFQLDGDTYQQASPNPDYPQPIQTVTGLQTISINSTDYLIDLGSIELCKLGTYQDYIYKDGEDWKVHKATVSAIIDGSENWSTSGTNTFYVANIYSKIGNSIQSTSTGEMYASHFTIADITSSNTLVGASLLTDAAHNVSNLRIRLQDMSGGTAGFRQMLSAKKPSIYARRLTPTDTTITDTNLIAQLEAIHTASLGNGTNTITNTATGTNLAGDMEFDYYEYDPTNRYDKWLWLRANNAYEEFNEEGGGGGGGGSITVDSALSTTSKNPVQNKVVTAAINSKVDSSSLATVATSGSYNDLLNKPTIPAAQVNSDWNAASGVAQILNKPTLATVATSGSYNDLTDKPTIPATNNISSTDWNGLWQ